MGHRTGLHPMVIIISIFFWGKAFDGVLGMIPRGAADGLPGRGLAPGRRTKYLPKTRHGPHPVPDARPLHPAIPTGRGSDKQDISRVA